MKKIIHFVMCVALAGSLGAGLCMAASSAPSGVSLAGSYRGTYSTNGEEDHLLVREVSGRVGSYLVARLTPCSKELSFYRMDPLSANTYLLYQYRFENGVFELKDNDPELTLTLGAWNSRVNRYDFMFTPAKGNYSVTFKAKEVSEYSWLPYTPGSYRTGMMSSVEYSFGPLQDFEGVLTSSGGASWKVQENIENIFVTHRSQTTRFGVETELEVDGVVLFVGHKKLFGTGVEALMLGASGRYSSVNLEN